MQVTSEMQKFVVFAFNLPSARKLFESLFTQQKHPFCPVMAAQQRVPNMANSQAAVNGMTAQGNGHYTERPGVQRSSAGAHY
jgi:hypothetical protein